MPTLFKNQTPEEELLQAARSGNKEAMDKLCFPQNSSISNVMLGNAYIEAAKHNQIMLMKHICFREGKDYQQRVSREQHYVALYECFKLEHFEMLEFYLDEDDFRNLLITCTRSMIKDNLNLSVIKQLAKNFFEHTNGFGFSESLLEICNEAERRDIYDIVSAAHSDVQNELKSIYTPHYL